MAGRNKNRPGAKPIAEVPIYDQKFFLKLALDGKKDEWNKWRHTANKDVRVTFAGINFSEAPNDQIDFSGFEFGDYANFSGCMWRGGRPTKDLKPYFQPGEACFDNAIFGDSAGFDNAIFGDLASFCSATFGARADFSRAIFGAVANFIRSNFGDNAVFESATFGLMARFDSARFGVAANFYGAAFDEFADFNDTFFKGLLNFTGRSNEEWSRAFKANADKADEKVKETLIALEQRHKAAWGYNDSGPDRFRYISFANARFDGQAAFSGRTFKGDAAFTNAHFYSPPDFDRTANANQINFTGARVCFVLPGKCAWTKDSKVLVRLRAVRKVAEETKNHDLERDLYIEERKAERGVYRRYLLQELRKATIWQKPLIRWRLFAHWLWIGIMLFYWALSNYGRNFVLPAAWLAASVWLFHCGYAAILTPLMPQTSTLDAAKYARAEWMVALGNAVPFVGPLTIDAEIKKFLFCPRYGPCLPIPPEGFQALVIAQNVLSIILVFFIGLALRNYFKIK